MTVELPEPIVAVGDVLPMLGFVTDWDRGTEASPVYRFTRGILKLSATQCPSFHARPQLHFTGIAVAARTHHQFDFTLPLAVESKEQAVAMIAYYIGSDFVPFAPIDWLDQGRQWKHLLPWERHWKALRERDQEYERQRRARPHCMVARDWMRMLRKQLRIAVDSADEHDEFVVEFDEHLFKITLPDTTIGVPARGPAPWICYRGRVASLAGLPARFLTDPVEIGIWDGRLEIGDSQFDVTPVGQTATAPIKFPATVPPGVELFDVEGIPVSLGKVLPSVPFCAAWDASPPRKFPPDSARRNGAPVNAARFERLIAKAQAES